ncbi:MAG: YggT family protein [Clostridiaceae bacterium]|nr:YggT family protein [Clostridiaceae bacterium]
MAEILSAAVVLFFRIVEILILLRIIISWIPFRRENRFIIFIYTVTEPILSPIRNLIARSAFGKNLMFDFSPILAYLLLGFLEYVFILIIDRL